jgi:hypothetical protein
MNSGVVKKNFQLLDKFIKNLPFLKKPDNGLDLHRWCLKAAEKYKYTCDIEYKIDMANRDNHHGLSNLRK